MLLTMIGMKMNKRPAWDGALCPECRNKSLKVSGREWVKSLGMTLNILACVVCGFEMNSAKGA